MATRIRHLFMPVAALTLLASASTTCRAAATPDGVAFFEKHIRPFLVERCYSCHSADAKKRKGELLLDSRQGIAKGGESGPVLVPGDPDASRLITAIRWGDPDLEMPPKRKLGAQQIEKFEQWVRTLGAPDPRDAGVAGATKAAKATTAVDAGRTWWAFQPVVDLPAPAVRQPSWPTTKVDAFVLAALERKQLSPSPASDPRTLIQRAYLDLIGLRPTYEEVEAFARDPSAAAYDAVIEKLLASPQYGERWGRYWLDVARYGEDNPTSEATNPGYPYAWRYRDWVIQALNQNVPYDRFVKLQLAADLMPGVPRKDFAALTFLGAGPVYHKDGRLSRDVIETLYTDDWDERVDTVTRGVLGLTVACARCHDHKFDPIPTRDYYALAGVFASTVAAPRPIVDVDAQAEVRFMAASQRIFYLSYAANLLRTDPGSKPREARQKVERFVVEMDQTLADMSFLRDKQPEMYAYLTRLARYPNPYDGGQRRAGPATRPSATTQPAIAQAWDDHSRINQNLRNRCPDMDRASAALIRDLKRRGLLDEVAVVWGGEFGRTPVSESGDGRDHNPYGFTMFMAGGGFRGGVCHGATDEFGFKAVQDRVSIHDLHATLLHVLGLDHEKLTYRYAGRDFRLTDVYGEVVRPLLT